MPAHALWAVGIALTLSVAATVFFSSGEGIAGIVANLLSFLGLAALVFYVVATLVFFQYAIFLICMTVARELSNHQPPRVRHGVEIATAVGSLVAPWVIFFGAISLPPTFPT